jgi:hypothetical protein
MASDITDENGNIIEEGTDDLEGDDDEGDDMAGVEGVCNGNRAMLKEAERVKREASKVRNKTNN